MGILIFSRQYTHFCSVFTKTACERLCFSYSEQRPKGSFAQDDRDGENDSKHSAIDFYFWPGIEQQSRYDNDDDNENLLIFRFYTILFGWWHILFYAIDFIRISHYINTIYMDIYTIIHA